MFRLFLYVVSASPSPDNVECLVPYRIDDREIFFGSCKRRLRKRLGDLYLEKSDSEAPNEEVFVVGVNGANQERQRKIVWAGRVTRLITFEVTYKSLTAPKYRQMRSEKRSPLHVRPLHNSQGKFTGYEHRSLLHTRGDGWVRDFTHINNSYAQLDGKRLMLVPGANRHQAFPRDCCLLLDNIFFAQGIGIPITNEMLDILKVAQPGKEVVDQYAIFGYRSDGSADGRTGRWLEMTGENAEKMMRVIEANIPTRPKTKPGMRPRLKSCKCR